MEFCPFVQNDLRDVWCSTFELGFVDPFWNAFYGYFILRRDLELNKT